MLFLMLAVFTLSTSSFKADDTIDCHDYAAEQATAGVMWMHDNGFAINRFTSLDLYLESYDDCQNGITGDVVWIAR